MIKDFSDYFKHTFFSTPCYQFVQFNTLHSIAEKKFHLVENYKLLQCYLNYYVYIISSYEIQQNIHTHRAIISPYNCDMQYPFYVIDRILPLNLSSFMKELLLLIMFNSHKIKYVEMHEHVISLLKISKDSTNYVHAWLYYFFSRVIPK
jgi:hypothetical protein